jgi:signal transduction histidine kinase
MLVKSTQLLSRSAARMSQLLDSLLTVNVAGLGGKMALGRSEVDLATECEEELQIQRAAFPSARIEMAVEGPCQGHFDASRIREALSNLVSNAVQHGLAHEPVQIALQGDAIQVRLSVSNGVDKPLSSGELELLFEPMRRREQGPLGGDRAHLGLGLFISREIARAHGGGIAGQCAGHKIIFTLWVPRQSSR